MQMCRLRKGRALHPKLGQGREVLVGPGSFTTVLVHEPGPKKYVKQLPSGLCSKALGNSVK